MNGYDFDGTIYSGDSSFDFYLYCLKRRPIIIKFIFFQCTSILMMLMGFYSKTKCKENIYIYFKGIPDIDRYVNVFWEKNTVKIRSWYLNQQKSDDVIISASPEFLLKPLCENFGVSNLIASIVDKKTGKYIGLNYLSNPPGLLLTWKARRQVFSLKSRWIPQVERAVKLILT